MRKIYYKGVIGEFISFLQDAKSTQHFEINGCNYWKLWADSDGSLRLDYPPRGQLEYVINLIKTEPTSRRILIDLWNPENRGKLSLDPCHTQYQFSVRNGKLDMIWTQRSVDFAVGAPSDFILAALYNITIANECDLIPGIITFNFGDTHIYEEHIDEFASMLRAYELYQCSSRVDYELTDSIYDVTTESLTLIDYEPCGVYKFELKA
jgi:thymidylate synthase